LDLFLLSRRQDLKRHKRSKTTFSRDAGALFLNAKAANKIAPKTVEIMAKELGKDKSWINEQIKEFNETAKNYLLF
jgi:glycerol-3-phosphate dehydrogenase